MQSVPPPRRRFQRRGWVLLVVFFGVWTACWQLNKSEPIYANQPLSYWMERMSDPNTAAEASSMVRDMGTEALPALVDALRTKPTALSEFTFKVAVKLRLAEARNYDAANVRATAAYVLGQMGAKAGGAVPELVAALSDEDALVRIKAVRALSQIGEPAIGDLTAALAHPEALVRFGAAKSLGAIGPRARRAEPALNVCLNDAQANVREAATQALASIRR